MLSNANGSILLPDNQHADIDPITNRSIAGTKIYPTLSLGKPSKEKKSMTVDDVEHEAKVKVQHPCRNAMKLQNKNAFQNKTKDVPGHEGVTITLTPLSSLSP